MSVSAEWMASVLAGVRPRVVAALLRYFRDLDIAEEAFQEASLKALTRWPAEGPPQRPAAWLIMVGRNAGVDAARRRAREAPLPDEADLSDLSDVEDGAAERIDARDYRDDILRLLFVCCDPELPATRQIALALRIVCGLSVGQIARAFLVGEAAMEQRITRAKRTIAKADIPFAPPGPSERARRLGAVSSVVYLMFNEGYTTGVAEAGARAPLAREAIRLARLLLSLYPDEPELEGLLALMLLTHARAPARFDADGAIVLLDAQDRSLWDRGEIEEGIARVVRAFAAGDLGPYQIQAAIAATHARAPEAAATNWSEIEHLYEALEMMRPSPVIRLNRAVAVFKARGGEAALELMDPLAGELDAYFYFHGARGAVLKALGRREAAREAFVRAIALAGTSAEAAHIRAELDSLDAMAGIAEP
ncbi:RNA polymerase sigma factor [Acuticoccus sp. M5D2P5]|uniref:RNA polymerase sigma factor n=1 Tax=Acuticoccus kalidii TaxID=2910977 RepID=UPI001F41177E|nr:RNA polymerase sigma factor [Acuticoccus kalidii]MCF3933113.1 RNA polymerase sigma factor [Acuticoccus kalidii]